MTNNYKLLLHVCASASVDKLMYTATGKTLC